MAPQLQSEPTFAVGDRVRIVDAVTGQNLSNQACGHVIWSSKRWDGERELYRWTVSEISPERGKIDVRLYESENQYWTVPFDLETCLLTIPLRTPFERLGLKPLQFGQSYLRGLLEQEMHLRLEPIRVLVCGSRFWTDQAVIHRELSKLPRGAIIYHGDCRGADRIADRIARRLGMPDPKSFPADWNRLGKAAGPIRNSAMLAAASPDLVLAFHPSEDPGGGTGDMIGKARAQIVGVEVRIING